MDWKREQEINDLQEQTIMFWNLQLQFMEMSSFTLSHIIAQLEYNELYCKNKFSKSIKKIRSKIINGRLSEKDHNCLATHLALQLSGLGDI